MDRSFSAVYRGVAVKANVAKKWSENCAQNFFIFGYTDVSIATACEEISAGSD